MPNKDEDSIKENLKYASSYLDLDADGEEATLDGNFTLAELEQIVKVMRNRNTPEFPDVMFCTTEEFLGTETIEKLHKIAEDMQRRLKEDKAEGLEMAEKLAEDITNNMNKTVLDIVEDTTKSKDKPGQETRIVVKRNKNPKQPFTEYGIALRLPDGTEHVIPGVISFEKDPKLPDSPYFIYSINFKIDDSCVSFE